jgi:uncharacterized protein
MSRSTRRCVLLFSRSPREEARAKGLCGAETLFALAAERIAEAAALCGFDLLVVGGGGPKHAGPGRVAQRGHGFAERLANAFADAEGLGYEQVVVVPGDVPGLDATVLGEARRALDLVGVVLGPSPDGGVFLLGCAPSLAREFRDVRWQTGAVFADLCAKASGLGLAVQVLRALDDVDRLRDLDLLARRTDLDLAVLLLVRELRGCPASHPFGVDPRLSGLFQPLAFALRGPPALS